jgi:hypothetical protein
MKLTKLFIPIITRHEMRTIMQNISTHLHSHFALHNAQAAAVKQKESAGQRTKPPHNLPDTAS